MQEKNTKEIDWVVAIDPPEADPFIVKIRSKGIFVKPVPDKDRKKCDYLSCDKIGSIKVDEFCFCQEHCELFVQKLLDNPQNR